MTNYPNIEAIANGTISGEFRDWVKVKPEAIAILTELKRLEAKLNEDVAWIERPFRLAVKTLEKQVAALREENARLNQKLERELRAQREGCRVCATKAVGLPTPGYTHDESCAQREEKK